MRPRARAPARLAPAVRLVALAAAVGAATVACDVMTFQPTPRPSRLVATQEPAPEATPTEIDEVPTIRPGPSGTEPGLVDAADALSDLDSYRVAISASGLVPATTPGGSVTMSATLVQGANPSASFRMTGVDGYSGGRLEAVVIGDQAWLKEGAGHWLRSPGGAADYDAAFTTMSPTDLVGQFDVLAAALQRVGTERRNGQASIHYRVTAANVDAAADGLHDGSVDAWVATKGGYLVSLAIAATWDIDGVATPVRLTIEVTRVNDKANHVVPPI